jgi:dTDP-4-amino-4,6-dideoxygalactose transaminase
LIPIWVATIGPNVNGLEQDLEFYLGHDAAVETLSSGTAAIHLGLVLLGTSRGRVLLCIDVFRHQQSYFVSRCYTCFY